MIAWAGQTIALVGLLLAPCVALAQNATLIPGSGYTYPRSPAGTACSPQCIGVAAYWVVPHITHNPAFSTAQGAWQWIGLVGTGPLGGNLGQAGTQVNVTNGGVKSCLGFTEMLPAAASFNSFSCNEGDVIYAEIECTANCVSGTSGQHVTITLTNLTQGTTWSNNFTTWSMGLGLALVGFEPASFGNPDTSQVALIADPVVRFSGAKVNQGSGLQPVALSLPMNGYTYADTSGANGFWATTSYPFGSGGNDFNACLTSQTGGLLPACPAGPYTTGVGLGP